MKQCTKCKEWKPFDQFHRRTRAKDGLNPWCKQCHREADQSPERVEKRRKWFKERYAENPHRQRDAHYRFKYGLSVAEFDAMVAEQSGLCAICGQPPVGQSRLFVDHDHRTGKVRKLLCRACNSVLGLMNEDSERLEKAAQYIRTHGDKA